MESTQLYLNEQLVTITADSHTIKKLNDDDQYLAEYVNKAAKMGQFHFLFTKEPNLRRIVVKRAPSTLQNVWYKKGRPSETDISAATHLLKLRNSEKYSSRFKNSFLKNKLWEEIAAEMRMAGYDVDGPKCAQKFLNLTQKGPEMGELGTEMKSEEDDDEWVPKNKLKKKSDEDDCDFLKKFIKKNSKQKEERYREMCGLIRRKNELLEEKLKQNREIITLLGKLVKN
ncbi:uncharacterized protein LOC123008909 [Tribolium madens]|uniref:uncharacterized protein LOC123008909 n=1 Tax=Tribolium madens TaxID=41895 RepID=UPI001CF72701|nr:uncharacterized protein LOC123008909 [Tribolium madens]